MSKSHHALYERKSIEEYFRVSPTALLCGYLVFVAYSEHEVAAVATGLICCIILGATRQYWRTYISFWPIAMGLLAIIALSTLSTLNQEGDLEQLAKGVYQLSRPLLFIIAGYLIFGAIRNTEFLFAILFASLILSVSYLTRYFLIEDFSSANRHYVRQIIGVGHIIWSVAIPLSIIHIARQRNSSIIIITSIILLMSIFALITSGSRSYLIATICVMAALFAPVITIRATVYIVILIFSFSIFTSTPILEMAGAPVNYELLAKIPLVGEMSPIVSNDTLTLNTMWRGFESRQAFYSPENPLEILFGQGLSGSVDIGFTFVSGQFSVSNIPVFHSGYSLLMVKSGVAGIAAYLFSMIFYALHVSRFATAPLDLMSRVSVGMFIFSVYAMASTAGYFNIGESGAMIGLLIGAAAVPRSKRARW